MRRWLSAHGLEAYAPGMLAKGYDKLVFLRGLGETEIADIIRLLQMPLPHARALRAGLAELVPLSANAVGGAAPMGTVQAQMLVPLSANAVGVPAATVVYAVPTVVTPQKKAAVSVGRSPPLLSLSITHRGTFVSKTLT